MITIIVWPIGANDNHFYLARPWVGTPQEGGSRSRLRCPHRQSP
nr:MAG TPA: hypothetical protein [Caudoviricetes sp.]